MFAYIDASALGSQATAILQMPGVTVDQAYCLEFFYHMHGSDINSLAVGVNFAVGPVFTIEGGRSLAIVETSIFMFFFVYKADVNVT